VHVLTAVDLDEHGRDALVAGASGFLLGGRPAAPWDTPSAPSRPATVWAASVTEHVLEVLRPRLGGLTTVVIDVPVTRGGPRAWQSLDLPSQPRSIDDLPFSARRRSRGGATTGSAGRLDR
jgi:hypothetical protein